MNDKILSYALSFALFISSTSTTFSRELCPKEIQDMQTELKNCEAKRCENPDDFNSCDLAKEQNFLNCRSGVLSKYENLKGNNQICKSDLQEIKEKIESNIQKELLSCDQYKCSEPFSPSVCDFQKEQMFISCRADVISKYQDFKENGITIEDELSSLVATRSTGKRGDDSNITSTILGAFLVALGVSATRIVSQCSGGTLTYSAVLMGLAGLYFLSNLTKLRNLYSLEMRRNFEDTDNSNLDANIDYVLNAQKNVQLALNKASELKSVVNNTAYALSAATGIAYAEWAQTTVLGNGEFSSCNLFSSINNLKAPDIFNETEHFLINFEKSINSNMLDMNNFNKYISDYLTLQNSTSSKLKYNEINSIQKIINYLISPANAENNKNISIKNYMFGAGLSILALANIQNVQETILKNVQGKALVRAIFGTTATGLAFMYSSQITKVEEEYRNRIKDYNEILNGLNQIKLVNKSTEDNSTGTNFNKASASLSNISTSSFDNKQTILPATTQGCENDSECVNKPIKSVNLSSIKVNSSYPNMIGEEQFKDMVSMAQTLNKDPSGSEIKSLGTAKLISETMSKQAMRLNNLKAKTKILLGKKGISAEELKIFKNEQVYVSKNLLDMRRDFRKTLRNMSNQNQLNLSKELSETYAMGAIDGARIGLNLKKLGINYKSASNQKNIEFKNKELSKETQLKEILKKNYNIKDVNEDANQSIWKVLSRRYFQKMSHLFD